MKCSKTYFKFIDMDHISVLMWVALIKRYDSSSGLVTTLHLLLNSHSLLIWRCSETELYFLTVDFNYSMIKTSCKYKNKLCKCLPQTHKCLEWERRLVHHIYKLHVWHYSSDVSSWALRDFRYCKAVWTEVKQYPSSPIMYLQKKANSIIKKDFF